MYLCYIRYNLNKSILKYSIDSPVLQIKTVKELSGSFMQDNLRTYAYEGGGSSNESLGSVITGENFGIYRKHYPDMQKI